MKRRSLFKLLAGAAASCALEWGGVVEKVASLPKMRVIVNPAYATATYESVIVFHEKAIGGLMRLANNPNPSQLPRYDLEDGEFVEVPFYKEVPDELS